MRTGRASMFRDKKNGAMVKGWLTAEGKAAFDQARVRLKALFERISKRDAVTVSEADVIEYLARGEKDTRAYFKANQ